MTKGISILLCCHNSAPRLPQTLAHLAAQHLPPAGIPLELLLIDNASTDTTPAAALSEWRNLNTPFPLRILAEPTPGLMHARKKAVTEARHEYLLFCDDDNWLSPDYLTRALATMETNPRIGALGGLGSPVADTTLPDWFPDYETGYAVGPQAPATGDITPRGYLFGAGLFTRRAPLQTILDDRHPFLLRGRTGATLSAGDDSEICQRLILLGYTLHYDDALRYQHYIPSTRLTWTYRKKMYAGFTDCAPTLEKYHAITRHLRQPPAQKLRDLARLALKNTLRLNHTPELTAKLALALRAPALARDPHYRSILQFHLANHRRASAQPQTPPPMRNILRKLTTLGPGAPSVTTAIRNLGPLSYARYRLARRRNHHLPPDATLSLTTPRALHPLACRAHTSDLDVFTQIFVAREYAPLDNIPRSTPGLIIDAGANVGYSSAYLLTRFPNATLLALEPAPDNYATLVHNLAPYAPRARCHQAALWSQNTTLTIDIPPTRDGREWSRQVTPGNAGPQPGHQVPATTIPALLRDTNHPRISILKIDIEGAESEIFSRNTDWLAQVDTLVIELHSNKPPFPDARPIVARALSRHPFTRATHGELTIYRRHPSYQSYQSYQS